MDIGPLTDFTENIQKKAATVLSAAAGMLATQTREHIVEEVNKRLHSTREQYIDALSYHQVDSSTWVVSLDSSAMFIEEGINKREMIDDLLKSAKAKTARDGSRYLVVPFTHNKAPTKTPIALHSLQATLKSEMQKRGIQYGGIEKNTDGSPRLGLLHSFDINDSPIKTSEGAGQGHGAIGDVRQGMTGIPFLRNVRIYQKSVTDRTGQSRVQKSIMTFRVVSSKHKGTGRWVHPGLQAKKFFDEAYDWAVGQWENKIKNEVLTELTR